MNRKNIIPFLIGILFIIFSIYLSFHFTDSVKNIISKSGFGWVVTTVLVRLFISLSFARGLQLILKIFKPKIKSILTFTIGFIIGFGISFISPIYSSDYGDYSNNTMTIDHKGLTEITNGKYQIDQEPYLICFFLSTCPHCKDVSKLLGFMSDLKRIPKIKCILPSSEEVKTKFIKENNAYSFEFYTVQDANYIDNNSGGTFPSIYFIDQRGKTIKYWDGNGFNYTALDYIESYQK